MRIIRYPVGLGALFLVLVTAFLLGLRLILRGGRTRPICTRCGSIYMTPSHTPDPWDGIFALFGCLPYRCVVCADRFYRRKQAVEKPVTPPQ